MATLQEILSPSVVTGVISRIRTPQSRLQNFFGMQLGGANNNPIGRRYFSWDIFDKTRQVAQMRAPGTGPSRVQKQSVGRVTGVFPRVHEELSLDYETLHNLRAIGRPAGEVDKMGMAYITKQEEYLATKFANFREFMVSRMMKGSFQILQDGDNWYPVDTGGVVTVDYQLPAGNKNQLNMLGAGNIIDSLWSNSNTQIFGHILEVNKAFEQLTGRTLRHVWTDSTTWRYVTTNQQIHDVGGTANTVFAQFDTVEEKGPDGLPTNEFYCVLRALPWLKWHVYDGGLDINASSGGSTTFTRFFDGANGEVAFLPDPSSDWTEMLIGSEPVIDSYNSPAQERFGFYAWTFTNIKPASIELIAVDNAIPALYVPKAIAYGKTIF